MITSAYVAHCAIVLESDPYDLKMPVVVSSRNLFLNILSPQQQDVIPSSLLENYLSMTGPQDSAGGGYRDSQALCLQPAWWWPLTLGRKNWPCLREIYDTLASDMQVSEVDFIRHE